MFFLYTFIVFLRKTDLPNPVDYISVSASSLLCLSPRLSSVVLCVVLRANHRAGQVAFQGAVGQICLLDAAISTSLSRGNAILGHCEADMPARCLHERSPATKWLVSLFIYSCTGRMIVIPEAFQGAAELGGD